MICYYKIICIDNTGVCTPQSYILTKKTLFIWKHCLRYTQTSINKIDKTTQSVFIFNKTYVWYKCKQRPTLKDKVFMKHIEKFATTQEVGYEL